MANIVTAFWNLLEGSLVLNKLAGVFVIMIGLYNLHGHCISCKEPRTLLSRMLREKYGHERVLNFNIFLSIFIVVLGTYVLLV